MFVAAGTGNWTAAIFHLGTHAFFKAGLFLAAGSVMHGMEHGGSTRPATSRRWAASRKHMPITRWCFFIYCLAISGIVPFAGLLLEGRDPRRCLERRMPAGLADRATASSCGPAC